MNILVTTANGKVGQPLVRELASRGYTVRAAVHTLDKASAPSGVEPIHLEFSDPSSVRTAMEGIDTVALLTPPSPQQVDYATLAIDMAKDAGVRRIVRLSVLAAAMEPGIQLGRWHRAAERYLQASGLEWAIVRPGPFFQNLNGMYAAQQHRFELPAADAPVNHIHVDDVALAMAEVIDGGSAHTGAIHTVTGPEALSFAAIADRLSAGTNQAYQYDPLDPSRAAERFAKTLPGGLVPVLVELFAAFRSGAVGLKTSTFQNLTGREPQGIDAFAKQLSAA